MSPSSRWAHVGLITIMVLALGLCVWLFLDISATRKQVQIILSRLALHQPFPERLQSIYGQELVLDLFLGFTILVLGGMVFGFISFYVRTLKRLKDIESMDHYILKSITRGVLTVDKDGRVTSCNRAMQSILGFAPETAYLRPITDLFSSDDPILEMLQSAIERRNPQGDEEEEITYTRSDGESLPLRVTTSALLDEEERLIGSILLVKDLAPIRSLEERVRRQDRLAALGNLTRRILHEIRNPLSAMDLNLQLLQEHLERTLDETLDDKVRHYLHIVFSELYRMDMIVQNTHMSVNLPALEVFPLDLHQVIREVVMKMEAEVHYSGHALELELDDRPGPILGDRSLLIQAFMNLLKNALESMSGAKGRLCVTSHPNDKGQVVVKVEDSGRGIAWQDLPRIFDPYFTTKKKGTGLGLSIVYNIITQHGGDIHVGSWVGEGTLFELRFPLLREKKGTENYDGKPPDSHC